MIWPSYGENEANALFLATMQTLSSYFYLAGLAKFFMSMIANDNSTMVIITSICNDDDCTNYFPPVTAGEAAANKALVKKEKQLRFLIRKACKVIANLFDVFLCFIAPHPNHDSPPLLSLSLRRPPGSGS